MNRCPAACDTPFMECSRRLQRRSCRPHRGFERHQLRQGQCHRDGIAATAATATDRVEPQMHQRQRDARGAAGVRRHSQRPIHRRQPWCAYIAGRPCRSRGPAISPGLAAGGRHKLRLRAAEAGERRVTAPARASPCHCTPALTTSSRTAASERSVYAASSFVRAAAGAGLRCMAASAYRAASLAAPSPAPLAAAAAAELELALITADARVPSLSARADSARQPAANAGGAARRNVSIA